MRLIFTAVLALVLVGCETVATTQPGTQPPEASSVNARTSPGPSGRPASAETARTSRR